jgi:hypothetical protein
VSCPALSYCRPVKSQHDSLLDPSIVIAGLDPAIQKMAEISSFYGRPLDCRVKPGNDDIEEFGTLC